MKVSVSTRIKSLTLKLQYLEESLIEIKNTLDASSDTSDVLSIQTYKAELSDHKEQLKSCYDGLNTIGEAADREPVAHLYSKLKGLHFECCLKAKRILSMIDASIGTTSMEVKGLKVTKLEAPVFDGNIETGHTFGSNLPSQLMRIPI